jgi:hypothetical protein
MAPVIDWHRRGLVPLGNQLISDARCRLVHADFFELVTSSDTGFGGSEANNPVDAVLLDIDHSPSHWLNPENSAFYSQQGLQKLAGKIHSGGVFGLWSNDPSEDEFLKLLETVFESAQSHIVTFPNPYTGAESSNTVYLARKA